ncbi:hypothetical protein [Bartonella sp. DGB2]|uniref:hypothetical protein n=1 Tax=Bartonella sp. DGB2 TaxID=3388426 RepID=UPI00398FF4A8
MANLADETAGFTNFDATPDSAATRKSALIRETRPKWRLSYDKSLEGYLNSFGFKGWNIQTKAEAAYEFSRNVMAELHNPNSSPNPHVKAAAGAIRPILEDLGAQLHEEGIIGDLIQGGYAPLIPDKRRVRWFHANVEEQSVVELLADAFQKRNPELPRDLALKGGKAYFTNLHPASYNLKRDMGMQFMEANKEDFIKAVQADSAYNGGVTREQAEQLYETMERVIGKTTKEKGNYRHAKRRSLLDYNHEGTIRLKNGQTMPLKVYDFFNQDAVAVMEQYTSSAAGRLALARTLIKNPQTGEIALNGIRNDADLERVKHWLSDAYKDYYRKESFDYTDKLNNALANIDFLYKRLLDIPLEGHDTWLAKALQRARTYNFIRLMSNMGLNQLPEVAKTITVLGATSILHPAHMVKSLVNLVSGNRVFANALTDEISEMTGLGLMHLRHSPHALGAALQTSKDVAATLGQKLDHALGFRGINYLSPIVYGRHYQCPTKNGHNAVQF